MTGERHSDEPDFLDDDFAIDEDLTGKPELSELFEAEDEHAIAPAGENPDEEDVLFTDHTEGLRTSESFTVEKSFREDAASTWNGDGLELEEQVGVPSEGEESPELVEAEETFAEELNTLLEGEEEFGLDSEHELELVGGASAEQAPDEISMSGPFVIDEGEGSWQDEEAATPAAAAAEVETGDEFELAAAAAEAGHEEGWEPLPASQMDTLAEVGEVAAADGEDVVYGDAAAEDELVGAAAAYRPALVGDDEVEGHDIYADEAADNQLIVAPARRGRGLRLLMSLAASLALLAGGAVVVLRPEWFGLRNEPERVQQVQVPRPKVAVTVPMPAQPGGAATTPKTGEPKTGEPKTGEPKTGEPSAKDPGATVPPVTPMPTDPQPAGPTATDPQVAQVDPPKDPQATDPQATDPVPPKPPTDPVATVDPTPVPPTDPVTPPTATPVPQTVPSAQAWPVPQTSPSANLASNASRSPEVGSLVRVNDDLMIGEPEALPPPVQGLEGVVPGTRAFAQLHNGNYFIGSVKAADADRLTLKMEHGEVTLQVASIARLTQLGSADYEQLQQVTSGFVRLTNNNRLVGSILSGIADDHIVLEFRSNRVMLPKSVIGEIVQGQGDDDVRLDTTREEDAWLRQMSERQLGSGQGPTAPKQPPVPAPQDAAKPR